MATPYETKFAGFLEMCAAAKKGKLDVVLIHHPEVLGDNYEEIVESLVDGSPEIGAFLPDNDIGTGWR